MDQIINYILLHTNLSQKPDHPLVATPKSQSSLTQRQGGQPDYTAEFQASAINPDMIDLNIKWVDRGEEIFEILDPDGYNPAKGRLSPRWMQKFANYQTSPGWVTWGVDVLNGKTRCSTACFKPVKGSVIGFDPVKQKERKYLRTMGRKAFCYFPQATRALWTYIAFKKGLYIDEKFFKMPAGVGFWAWVLENAPHLTIQLVEGEKKALSVLCGGEIAISLPGIYGGYNKIKEGPNKGTRVLKPELEMFVKAGAKIAIAFDTDLKPKTRERVAQATQTLGNLIYKASGQEPIICKLPLLLDGKGAVDDYIARYGMNNYMEKIVGKAKPLFEWEYSEYRASLTSRYDASVKVNSKSLDRCNKLKKTPTSGIVVIKSAKGTGKTKLISNLIANRSAVALGHRITLMKELCNRLNLLYRTNVIEIGGRHFDEAGNIVNRVGACVESIFSVPLHTQDLVLDEGDQVLRAILRSPTCNKDGARPAILSRFEELVCNSERIILSSADVSDADIDTIVELRKKHGLDHSVHVIENTFSWPGYTAYFYEESTDTKIINELMSAIQNDLKVFVVTDSKAETKALDHWISRIHQMGKKVLVINQETSGEEEMQYKIANLNEVSKNYDVIIASPSLASGVSIENHHFDLVFGLYYGVVNETDISQALSRVRQPIERHIWVQTHGRIGASVSQSWNPSAVKQALLKSRDKEASLLRSSLQTAWNPEWDSVYDFRDSPYLTHWATLIARHNRSMMTLRRSLKGLLVWEGHKLIPYRLDPMCQSEAEVEATKAEHQAIKKEIKEKELEAKAGVCDLDKSTYNAMKSQPYLSPPDKTKVNRYEIAQFYYPQEESYKDNPVDIPLDLVKKDAESFQRSGIVHLEELEDRNLASERSLKSRERQIKRTGKVWLPDTSVSLGRNFIDEVLEISKYLDLDRDYTLDDIASLVEKMRAYPTEIKAFVGFSPTPKMPDAWHFRMLMEKLGLKLIAKKEDRKVVSLRLDPEHYAFVREVLDRRAEYRSKFEKNERHTPPLTNEEHTPPCVEVQKLETPAPVESSEKLVSEAALDCDQKNEADDAAEILMSFAIQAEGRGQRAEGKLFFAPYPFWVKIPDFYKSPNFRDLRFIEIPILFWILLNINGFQDWYFISALVP